MRNSMILAFLVVFVGISIQAQESDLFNLWPDTILAQANSAKEIEYMSKEEKQVVYFINLCRHNPTLFSETILIDYLKANDIKKDKDVKGLIDQLESTESKKMLQPSESLTQMARTHAKDMGETGRTGHSSSTGKSFKDRSEPVSKKFNGLNENANYGNEKGIDIVIDLLIDRNVPHAGHRKNILDPEMHFLGVAIEPHKRYGMNSVQDFGGPKRN